jgi:hypothetical protein
MTKLTGLLAAGALALSLNGSAFAADEKPQDQTANPADQSKQEQEYLAALKKCDSQQGADKQKCIDKAKEKFNRM